VAGRRADAVFQLLPNEYKGRRTAQLRLIDLRPLDAPPAPLEASPR
jgi:hypothetical protein